MAPGTPATQLLVHQRDLVSNKENIIFPTRQRYCAPVIAHVYIGSDKQNTVQQSLGFI